MNSGELCIICDRVYFNFEDSTDTLYYSCSENRHGWCLKDLKITVSVS